MAQTQKPQPPELRRRPPSPGGAAISPEIPDDPMEFLARSWSASALQLSKAFSAAPQLRLTSSHAAGIDEDLAGEEEEDLSAPVSGNPFAFASAATSQLVVEKIMSQEVTPPTSGRPSHSSGPFNCGGGGESPSDSPPLSPSDIKEIKQCRTINTAKPHPYKGTNKTVGRWLKERREKKKEETRTLNAQLHAAVSVASVAAAVAAIAAATAAASGDKDDRTARTDMAVAAAATLVAAQCVEAAESMGAEREHLTSVVSSAVNVKTPGDIITLTAAAATALRGAATLKARALKEAWNVAAVIPVEKGEVGNHYDRRQNKRHEKELNGNNSISADEIVPEEKKYLGLCYQELLARGSELLKQTRKGALHWKIISVYINRMNQVMLKMKSRHVAGTIVKKKKFVVIDVCKDIKAWPGRHLLEGGDQRRYFGLKTAEHRVIEFECPSRREYKMWTQGVSRLLKIVEERKRRN